MQYSRCDIIATVPCFFLTSVFFLLFSNIAWVTFWPLLSTEPWTRGLRSLFWVESPFLSVDLPVNAEGESCLSWVCRFVCLYIKFCLSFITLSHKECYQVIQPSQLNSFLLPKQFVPFCLPSKPPPYTWMYSLCTLLSLMWPLSK